MQTDKMEELLMDLSGKITSMAKDIEAIKSEMRSNYIRADENDNSIREVIEERNRSLKAELQGEINLLKKTEELQEKQNEIYNVRLKGLETSLVELKNEKKNKVFTRWEQIGDKAFYIVLAIIFGAVLKFFGVVVPKM